MTKHTSLPKILLLFAVFVLPKAALFSQEAADYRGVWQTKTPDAGEWILIIKRNNFASYFSADNADRTVYQGTWSSNADCVFLTWKDGSAHEIKRSSTGYVITHFDAANKSLYTHAVRKLPDDILGQWAKAPSTQEDSLSDRDKAKGFFGTWKLENAADTYYLVIEPDRSAASNWTNNDRNHNGLQGSWAKQGSELHIAWDTGHYGILKQNERNFTFKLIEPGALIEKDAADEWTANRTSENSLPEALQTLYTGRDTPRIGGTAFADRKKAASFYRGSWIIQRTDNSFEQFEIGRFGGLKTSADATLYGNWRMSGRAIFMNWDDSMRTILRPVGSGFILYEYKPGRPTDGVPTRVFPATPQNTKKLAAYADGRWSTAQQLLELARKAEVAQTELPLEADLDSPNKGDPWWWPLWSENPSAEKTEPAVTERNTVKIATRSEPGNAEQEPTATKDIAQSEIKETTTHPPKPNWDWPF